MDELRTYDNGENSKYLPYLKDTMDRRSMFWYPGSFTAQEAFDVSIYRIKDLSQNIFTVISMDIKKKKKKMLLCLIYFRFFFFFFRNLELPF